MKKCLAFLLILALVCSMAACNLFGEKSDYTYEYYADGTVKEKVYRNPDGSGSESWYYSKDGRLTYYSKHGANGNLLLKIDSLAADSRQETYYHEDGNIKESLVYENDVLYYRSEYHANSSPSSEIYYYTDGQVKSHKKMSEDGVVTSYETFFENGNCENRSVYDEEGVLELYVTHYENGESKHAELYEGGKLVSISEYYENGQMRLNQQMDGDKILMTITYDENGNITGTYIPEP